MAAKLDKEMMKKQHFWLLLIPLFVGLLLAWLGLFFGVADATETKETENKTAKDGIEKTKAQAKKQLEEYDKRKEVLFGLRTERWKEMWNLQQGIYQWPDALGEVEINKVKDLKFGADISDAQFKALYRDQSMKGYEDLAKDAAPIQFAGDWRTALRTVPAWKRNPESEDIWLATEDYWVQKELINALVEVNKDGGKFRRPTDFAEKDRKPEWKNDPKERTFIGRTWQLDLKLVDTPDGTAIQGSITNLTPRLQPFNATGGLLFNVWLVDDPDAKPFLFLAEGTSQEGGKKEPIKFLKERHIVREGRAIELVKVEQVFDIRTAPVKRVDQVVLGALADRQRQAELQMTAFSTKAAETDTAAAAAAGGAAGGPASALGGSASGPPPGMTVAGGPGGPGGPGASGSQTSTDFTYNGLARRRYINITGQVRAMPVGLVVVADQGYVQDVLTALANCKLRFQTIQTTLARFRGSLSYLPQPVGGYSPFGSSPGGTPPRGEGSEGPGPGDGRRPGVGAVPGGPPGGVGSIPGGPPRPGGASGMFGPGMSGGMFGGGPISSSDDQTAGNLIEVTTFGIAALYEKFDTAPKKDDAAAGPAGTGTAPTGGPAPMPPAPATAPAGPAAPTPGTAPTPPAAPPKL
jgi:hypothetical protein